MMILFNNFGTYFRNILLVKENNCYNNITSSFFKETVLLLRKNFDRKYEWNLEIDKFYQLA